MRRTVVTGTLLTSREAGVTLGVSSSAVKRWADDGTLPSTRTAGGHRRFAREDLQRFLEQLDASRCEPSPLTDDIGRWIDILLNEAEPFAAQGQLYVERGRLGSWWAVANVLGQVLARVGSAWAAGRMTVYQEHLVSERLARALTWCCGTMPTIPNGPVAVLAAVPVEEHMLGLNLVELTLRAIGWRTLWIGAIPLPEGITGLLQEQHPQLLCISASSATRDRAALGRIARRLARLCRSAGTRLLLGGQAPWPDELSYGQRVKELQQLHTIASAMRR